MSKLSKLYDAIKTMLNLTEKQIIHNRKNKNAMTFME